MTWATVTPSARPAKLTAMRCRNTGGASATTSSTDGLNRPSINARARQASIRAWLARGPGPHETKRVIPSAAAAGPAGADQRQDRLDDAFADRDAAHQALRRHQLGDIHRRPRPVLGDAGGRDQHFALGLAVGIIDVDLQQEPVELGLGQRIGAFLLQRVLGRQHMKRPRQRMILAGDRDPAFLHRLQQRRLGARARPVDLVRHQQLAEHRPRDKAERAPSALAFLEHFGAQNIGRHQVGRALNALVVQPEDGAQSLDQPGLGQAGHPDQQCMAAAQQGDQGLLDNLLLAKDDFADPGAHQAEAPPQRLDFGNEIGGGGVYRCGGGQKLRSLFQTL